MVRFIKSAGAGQLPGMSAAIELMDRAVRDFGEIVCSWRAARPPERQITLFESHGMCVEDLYAARHVRDAARQRNAGIDPPTDL